jgi:hypothetical protein
MSAIARSQLASLPMLNWSPPPRGNRSMNGRPRSGEAAMLVVMALTGLAAGVMVRGPARRAWPASRACGAFPAAPLTRDQVPRSQPASERPPRAGSAGRSATIGGSSA